MWSWSGEGSPGSRRQEEPGLGRCPASHGERQVVIIPLFMALFCCDNHCLIWAGALHWRLMCRGGASRGTPDACSQAIFPGKTLGTLAGSSCLNLRLQTDLSPLLLAPIPPTSWSCGEAETPAFVMLWVSGRTGLESPPHPTWETYSHLVVTVLRTGSKKRKEKQTTLPSPPRVACQTLVTV